MTLWIRTDDGKIHRGQYDWGMAFENIHTALKTGRVVAWGVIGESVEVA